MDAGGAYDGEAMEMGGEMDEMAGPGEDFGGGDHYGEDYDINQEDAGGSSLKEVIGAAGVGDDVGVEMTTIKRESRGRSPPGRGHEDVISSSPGGGTNTKQEQD